MHTGPSQGSPLLLGPQPPSPHLPHAELLSSPTSTPKPSTPHTATASSSIFLTALNTALLSPTSASQLWAPAAITTCLFAPPTFCLGTATQLLLQSQPHCPWTPGMSPALDRSLAPEQSPSTSSRQPQGCLPIPGAPAPPPARQGTSQKHNQQSTAIAKGTLPAAGWL